MSTLPFQGEVFFGTFVPNSGFGTYAMLTAMVDNPGLNETHAKSYIYN
jgi:hypothetical protein